MRQKQLWEIIISYRGEKPTLPTECQYWPYPYTHQPDYTEKVHQGTDRTSATIAFETLQQTEAIVRIDLFHGGGRRRQWLRPDAR